MTVEEIKQSKRAGDLKIAAEMIGISQQNAFVALKRAGSKYHQKIIEALSQIIEMRSHLINKKTEL